MRRAPTTFEDLFDGILRLQYRGIDRQIRVRRDLIRIADSSELRDLAGAGLRVRPLRSRCSHTSSGVETCTSRNRPCSSTRVRISERIASNGAIGAHTAMPSWRAMSEATQPMRCTLSMRSSTENPKPFDRIWRTSSPSRRVVVRLSVIESRSTRRFAIVDFPDPDNPVRSMTRPRGSNRRVPRLYDVGDDFTRQPRQQTAPSHTAERSPCD